MEKEYETYFLQELNFEVLKDLDKPLTEIRKSWGRLSLFYDDDKKTCGVKTAKDTSESTIAYGIIGYLSQEDSKRYLPYLKKNLGVIYDVEIVQKRDNEDLSKRLQIAVRIHDAKTPNDKIVRDAINRQNNAETKTK